MAYSLVGTFTVEAWAHCGQRLIPQTRDFFVASISDTDARQLNKARATAAKFIAHQ